MDIASTYLIKDKLELILFFSRLTGQIIRKNNRAIFSADIQFGNHSLC